MDYVLHPSSYSNQAWQWPGKAALRIYHAAKFLLGFVGVLLSIPLLGFLLAIFWFFLMWAEKQISKEKRRMFTVVNTMNDREKQELHLQFESEMKGILDISKEMYTESPSFTKPFLVRMQRIEKTYREIEATLRKAAYPELGTAQSEKDRARLQQTFQDLPDWEDENLDVYGKHYL